MERSELDRIIYSRYIEPTKKKEHYAGVEFEMPIVNLKKEAVDFDVVHLMVEAFIKKFGFEGASRDDRGDINSVWSYENGDDLSFDCSYNTMEFSFGREKNLNVLKDRFTEYYTFCREFLSKYDHSVTGMGINPYYMYNCNEPVPNGRYRMLLHHLKSYGRYEGRVLFHDIPYYGLIACSSQTHIDVSEKMLVRVINAFNTIEPLKALIFANSPMGEYLCVRDHLWRESMHGFNLHNVDGYEISLSSVEELVAYIRSMSMYCVEKDGKYINFEPVVLEEYFSRDKMYGEYYDGKGYCSISWKPEPEDIQYLRSFKFADLTFRGTVELRSTCMQPVSEAMASPAFNVGLNENLEKLETFISECRFVFAQGYSPVELRKMFVMKTLPPFADKDKLRQCLVRLLDIAAEGLKLRGMGEEHLIFPLYDRAVSLINPALEMVNGMEKGNSIEYYIEKFGRLEV